MTREEGDEIAAAVLALLQYLANEPRTTSAPAARDDGLEGPLRTYCEPECRYDYRGPVAA